jgi:pantoate--beta-alanine ligase
MVVFKHIKDLRHHLHSQLQSQTISFIPTMGALHTGHLSLVTEAAKNGAVTVASIFVNPTQFNNKADLEHYPRSIEQDLTMLHDAGCNVVFTPEVEEIYPTGATIPSFNFGYLDTILEGAKRPGHFNGVGQVMSRLIDIIDPHKLYLGQKDYQQCLVITDLLRQLGKDNIEVIICPTMREPDGLAMSSRNRRLTEPQRAVAGLIYQCLVSIQAKQATDKFDVVQKECNDLLAAKGFTPEYVVIADAKDLGLLADYDKNRKMVALIAARLGDIRLIDNLLLN